MDRFASVFLAEACWGAGCFGVAAIFDCIVCGGVVFFNLSGAAFASDRFEAAGSVAGLLLVGFDAGTTMSGCGGGDSKSQTVPPAAMATKTNKSIAGRRAPLRVESRGPLSVTILLVSTMSFVTQGTVWDQLLTRALYKEIPRIRPRALSS